MVYNMVCNTLVHEWHVSINSSSNVIQAFQQVQQMNAFEAFMLAVLQGSTIHDADERDCIGEPGCLSE